MEKYDLIIIGAGPAGLTAAIYAARYKLKTLVIGKTLGGLTGSIHEIGNFPSYEKITGMELMMKMINQVKKLGVEIKPEEVLEINKKNIFEVSTGKKKYFAKKIIIATGAERKKLGLKGEEKFFGKGVSYCATCDSVFFKDKIVGVVGGGNAALTTAILLERFAKKVYIIYRKEKFTGLFPNLTEQIERNKKISVLFNSDVTQVIGKNRLEEIELNKQKKLKIDGLFIEIGSSPNLELVKKINVKTTDKNIIVDKNQKTNVEGIFAAGDITNTPIRQITTACGEGSIAATSAYDELTHKSISKKIVRGT